MYRRIGLSKRHHSCDHCGKRDLASTVVFSDGSRKLHLGSACAKDRSNVTVAARRDGARAKERVKSAQELADETEFYRRQTMPRVDKRYMPDGRGGGTAILHHHQLGEVGSRTEIAKRGKVISVLYVLPKMPHNEHGYPSDSANSPGSRNMWIWRGTTPIVRSRNLRGLINYAGKNVIRQISIARGPEHSGLIDVFFDNGAEFHGEFASYAVLQTFLRESRNFQGAPLEANGRDVNVVMRDNPALKNY